MRSPLDRPRASGWLGSVAVALALAACGPSVAAPPDGSLLGDGDGGGTTPPDLDAGAGPGTDAGVITSPDAGGGGSTDAAPPGGCAEDPEGDTEGSARVLDDITDCDDEGVTFQGTLDGADDIDYVRVFADDTAFCRAKPELTSRQGGDTCLFADCAGADVTCETGTAESSPAGFPGCCGVGSVVFSLNCDGGTDAPDLYVRSSGGSAGECTPYSVDLHY